MLSNWIKLDDGDESILIDVIVLQSKGLKLSFFFFPMSDLNKPLNDPLSEIESDLLKINEILSQMKKNVDSLNSPRDTPALRRKIKHDKDELHKLINECSQKLTAARPSFLLRSPEDRRSFERCAKQFQEMSRKYETILHAYSNYLSSKSLPAAQDEAAHTDASQGERQLQYSPHKLKQYDTTILETERIVQQERHDAIREVVAEIRELREICEDVRDLAFEQADDVKEITANVSSSLMHVDKGVEEIQEVRAMSFVYYIVCTMLFVYYPVCILYFLLFYLHILPNLP